VAASLRAKLRLVPNRVYVPKVLAAVSFDDDVGLERRRILPLPEEELLTVALETDFYEHETDVGCGM
jgi:hypothetical protein